MSAPIHEHLRQIIGAYADKLRTVAEPIWNEKPSPSKWSKKEILGHLVDSAQNNVRRFVIAQYEREPFIRYNQDEWVKLADYQHYPKEDLLRLWELLNLHICRILVVMAPGQNERKCLTGGPEGLTIEWLAEDYVKHLLHHLHQILDLEPIAYP